MVHPASRFHAEPERLDAAAGVDVMEEGTSRAIPLRRSRGTTRAVTVRPRGWTERITTNVRRAFEPPRQIWLASLGSTALTLRGVRDAWARLVTEGAEAESWLRRSLGRGTPSENGN